MLKTALVAASLVAAATAANASTRSGLEGGFHGNAATALGDQCRSARHHLVAGARRIRIRSRSEDGEDESAAGYVQRPDGSRLSRLTGTVTQCDCDVRRQSRWDMRSTGSAFRHAG